MRMVFRGYFAFYIIVLLALVGNAILPFAAPAGANGKTLICTSEGYRFIDSKGLPKTPITPHKPHCLLCVLAGANPPLTPSAATITASHTTFVALALPKQQVSVARFAHALFISRAPPALS